MVNMMEKNVGAGSCDAVDGNAVVTLAIMSSLSLLLLILTLSVFAIVVVVVVHISFCCSNTS